MDTIKTGLDGRAIIRRAITKPARGSKCRRKV
jgi:hypothetical protein